MNKEDIREIARSLQHVRSRLLIVQARLININELGLIQAHDDWLDLYQLGQEISFLAERLDTPYQTQEEVSENN